MNKDNRDSDEFRVYLKASNITNTQRIMNTAVSISDKYGIEVSSKISKSSYSIDFWLILGGISAIDSLFSRAFSVIKYFREEGGTNDGEIKTKYDSLSKAEKRLVRSILQAVQNLDGRRKLVEITYKGFNIKFEPDQFNEIEPIINFLLEKQPTPLAYYSNADATGKYNKKVDLEQEILTYLRNKDNMETSYKYLIRLNKSSLPELTDSEKNELLGLLREEKK